MDLDDKPQKVMRALAAHDQVAYVRFASVYKDFREARDFEQFVVVNLRYHL